MGQAGDYGTAGEYPRQGDRGRRHGQPEVPPQFGWPAAQDSGAHPQHYDSQYQPQHPTPQPQFNQHPQTSTQPDFGSPAQFGSQPPYAQPEFGMQPRYGQPEFGSQPPYGQPEFGSQPRYAQSQFGAPPQYALPPQYTPPPGYAPPPSYAPPPPQYALPPRRSRHIARKVIGGIGGLIALIVVIGIAASSGHSVQTAGSTAANSHGGSTQQTAGIGTAITLTGNTSGEKMAVTVTKVIANAQPGDEFTSAPAGDRLYAVQFRLSDSGSAAYSDAPSNGAAVVDSKGQSYESAVADTAVGCPSFPATENVAPGASGLGCIVFEVPASAKITQVQFTLDSGMGPDTGQWAAG